MADQAEMQTMAAAALDDAIAGREPAAYRKIEALYGKYHSEGLVEAAILWADQVTERCHPEAAAAPPGSTFTIRTRQAGTGELVEPGDRNPDVAWAADWLAAAMTRDMRAGMELWKAALGNPAPKVKALLLISAETIRELGRDDGSRTR